MKIISTKGLYNMRPVSGSAEWYWCCDYVSGDLYEAEELYQDGHPIKQNRLLFLHYPDGHTVEPIVAHEGQYFGAPGFENGRLQILMEVPVSDPEASVTYYLVCLKKAQKEYRALLAAF